MAAGLAGSLIAYRAARPDAPRIAIAIEAEPLDNTYESEVSYGEPPPPEQTRFCDERAMFVKGDVDCEPRPREITEPE